MGFLDKFERSVEKAVNNAFSKAFKSEVKPVELASALRRDVDDRAAALGVGRTVVPNEFTIELSSSDLDHVEDWGAEALADELAANVTEHAATQHYAFVGPVTVSFEEAEDLPTGRFQLRSATVRGAVAPATSAAPSPRHPLLDIDGQRYNLTGKTTIIGRGTEADIVVDDNGVSRKHISLEVTPEGTILTDLGSTNGTFVEEQRITEVTLVDGNAIRIGRTVIMYWDAVVTDED